MGFLALGFMSPTRVFNFVASQYLSFWGLEKQLVAVDHGSATVMECWAPKRGDHARGRKPALVLIHAFGLTSLTWCRQVASFSRHFELYIPNLLFSGLSATAGADRTEIFQAECVHALLRELGVHQASVVGTSYGGFVAYRLAHLFPRLVRKLVLSSSAVNMTPETDMAMVRRFGTRDVTEILQPGDVAGVRRAGVLAFWKQPPFVVPAFVCNDLLKVLFNVNRKEKLELLEGLQLRKPDAPPLPKISQEVLLIWGEHDPVFDVRYAHQLKEWIGDDADVVILKDAAHVPQAEVPHDYNKKVLEFLTRPLRGS